CASGQVYLGCETALFWVDLTDAQLIPDAFRESDGGFPATVLDSIDEIAEFLPSAPIRDSAFVSVFPHSGRNYYAIATFTEVATTGAQTFAASGAQALTPLEAMQI